MVELASIRIGESLRGYVFDFVEDDFKERLERYASSAHMFTIDQCARKFKEKNKVRIGKHLRRMADYGILKPILIEGKDLYYAFQYIIWRKNVTAQYSDWSCSGDGLSSLSRSR